MNNKYKKIAIINVVVFILSGIFSYTYIYNTNWITRFDFDGPDCIISNIQDLNTVEINNEKHTLYVDPVNSSPYFVLDLKQQVRYLQINITGISTCKKQTIMICHDDSGVYNEENSSCYRMKEGNNVFVFKKPLKDKIRIYFSGDKVYNFDLNFIEYDDFPEPVLEFFLFWFGLLLLFIISILVVLNKKDVFDFVNRNKVEICFVTFICFFYFVWSMVLPYDTGPDEYMRYDVAEYIFNYKKLPRGDDPILVTAQYKGIGYGLSYAYSPYLAYLISAIIMMFSSVFGIAGLGLLHVARLTSVVSSTITAVFLIKISKKLQLKNHYLLPCLVCLMPEFVFVSAYVNNDAFAIMSATIICYAWILGKKGNWDIRSCICLAIGMALCLPSYYNCYGYLLISAFGFIIHYIYRVIIEKNIRLIKEMLIKGFSMVAFVMVFSGWWFVRNYYLYGSLLGTEVMRKTAIKYATPDRNPLNRVSLRDSGVSLQYMFKDMGWIKISAKSFVAAFDYMAIWISDNWYYMVGIVILLGLVLRLLGNKLIRPYSLRHLTGVHIMLFVSLWIVVVLSIIYSYTNEFQPQGRYLLPAIIPLMIFVTEGVESVKNRRVRLVIGIGTCLFMVAISVYCLSFVIIPYYYWS